MNVVRLYDQELAESFHASSSTRPFTVSNLMGRTPDKKLDPQGTYRLRLTSLQSDLGRILVRASQDGPLAPGEVIELDYIPFNIEQAEPQVVQNELTTAEGYPESKNHKPDLNIQDSDSAWCGSTTYQELSASLLLAKEPAPRRISLTLTSPTTFKSNAMNVPLPLPDLVFGSLLVRWNAFAPIAFPPETRRYAAECMAVSRYKLSTRVVPVKRGGKRIGAVGQITYTSLNYDRYWMSVIGVLAAFALYSGVGAGTTMGLGQCRLLKPKS